MKRAGRPGKDAWGRFGHLLLELADGDRVPVLAGQQPAAQRAHAEHAVAVLVDFVKEVLGRLSTERHAERGERVANLQAIVAARCQLWKAWLWKARLWKA